MPPFPMARTRACFNTHFNRIIFSIRCYRKPSLFGLFWIKSGLFQYHNRLADIIFVEKII